MSPKLKPGSAVVYVPVDESKLERVYLNGKAVGTICMVQRKLGKRYYYRPDGGTPGNEYDNIQDVKISLEAT